jgi:hypothetical protein
VVDLVEALNLVRGVRTVWSCGGHEHARPFQCPAGEWAVYLHPVTGWRTWRRGLGFLRRQVALGGDPRVWLDDERDVAELRGVGGISPDAVASRIARATVGPPIEDAAG